VCIVRNDESVGRSHIYHFLVLEFSQLVGPCQRNASSLPNVGV
jgi:hypothetical protein